MDHQGPSTAVAVDEWPLVRLGIVQVLRAIGITVVADVALGDAAVRATESSGARYLVIGSHRDLSRAEVARRVRALSDPPKILVLVEQISRDDLLALRAVGIDALLPRSVGPGDLADAVARVDAGERVVAPALLSLLVGALGPLGDDTSAGPNADRLVPLTRKELEVLARLSDGLSNSEIAQALYVTPATVKSHLTHIYGKLGVASRQEAIARAVTLGLLG